MTSALQRITSRRSWFVPGLAVWGVAGIGSLDYLATEAVDGLTTVYYGNADIGQGAQQVNFSQLVDDRGNHLPSSIDGPRVVIRATGEHTAFIVGAEADSGFKIARQSAADQPVTVDLLVIEHGR